MVAVMNIVEELAITLDTGLCCLCAILVFCGFQCCIVHILTLLCRY